MKRLVISLAVLLALAVAADRVAATVASRTVAEQARASSGLAAPPEVDIAGFPFLTQAFSGRYDRVEVAATDVRAGQLRLDRLDATLTGVQVSLSEALSGDVARVPVDGIEASALIGYAQLSQRSGERRLTVAPGAGGRVRVSGTVEVLGRPLTAVAVSRVEVVDGAVVLTAEEYEVGAAAADELITRALRGRFDYTVPVTGLPYGLQVIDLSVEPAGVLVRARAGATVLVPA